MVEGRISRCKCTSLADIARFTLRKAYPGLAPFMLELHATDIFRCFDSLTQVFCPPKIGSKGPWPFERIACPTSLLRAQEPFGEQLEMFPEVPPKYYQHDNHPYGKLGGMSEFDAPCSSPFLVSLDLLGGNYCRRICCFKLTQELLV